MPDIYGTGRQIYNAGTQVTENVSQESRNRAESFFGWSPQARGVSQNQANATGDAIQYALSAFGSEVLTKQSMDYDNIIRQIDQDLKDLRINSIQSRKDQNLKEYQHYTQLRAARAEQKLKLKQIQQQRVGEVLMGVASAVTTILAPSLGYRSALKEAQKPGSNFEIPTPENFIQRGIYRRNT